MASVDDMLRDLPPDVRQEIEAFIARLHREHAAAPERYAGQSWAGALRDLRDRYTSVELQKKALEWRSG